VSAVRRQVEVSASGWSLVQRSPTVFLVSLWSWSLDNEEAVAHWGAVARIVWPCLSACCLHVSSPQSLDEFWWSLVLVLCHRRNPHSRTIKYVTVCTNNMADKRTHAQRPTLALLDIPSWKYQILSWLCDTSASSWLFDFVFDFGPL
jgi:hypothetical protein